MNTKTQPVASESSSGERAESESAAFEKWVENSNRYHSHKIKGPIGGYARDMMACAQDGWMARAALLSSDAKPASEPVQAAFDRTPFCGVKSDGSCDKCEGSCMWFGKASEPVAVPQDVLSALDRMCTPLHESRLSGATAEADARCMKLIRDYVLSTAPSPAPVGINGLTKTDDRRVAELEEELSVSDKLLQHREQLLNAIPNCPVHGSGCVSHALEWIEKAKLVMQSEITTLPNDQERSMTADEAVKMAAHGLLAFADRNGVVLTIERTPLFPLAMGHAEYLVAVREKRGHQ